MINKAEFVDTDEQINDFVDYCLNLAASDQMSPSEKKGIYYLLQHRLNLDRDVTK